MKNKKRKNTLMVLIILLLGITIGFAILSTTLKINGSSVITKNTWDIYWDSVGNKQKTNNVTVTQDAVVNSLNKTIVNFNVRLNEPGDYYEFQVDAVNNGSIDAMLDKISTTVNNVDLEEDPTALPYYISYSVTYADGTIPEHYHLLRKKTNGVATRERYKVRFEFLTTISEEDLEDIDDEGEDYDFEIEITYKQADDNAIDRNAHNFQLGEYFTLVPDVTDYNIPNGLTGYENDPSPSSPQTTLHPSELTLWRVIDVHQDGSVDAISEYVSSTKVGFYGVRGYQNYVGALQTIASQYAKAGYTKATRMFGYDGQTLTIQDTSSFDSINSTQLHYPASISAPKPTSGTGEEYYGGIGGDTLYLKDLQLVKNVYATDPDTYGSLGIKAYNVNYPDSAEIYWISSREYFQEDSSSYSLDGLRGLTEWNGIITQSVAFVVLYDSGENMREDGDIYGVRPIITLKKNISVNSGTGTKLDPYTFN